MEKKYYNVGYINGDGDQEEGVTFWTQHFEYLVYYYMVANYETEVYYEKKKIQKFIGQKEITERKERRVIGSKFLNYVEEVDGKYYDIVTGIEVSKYCWMGYGKESILEYFLSLGTNISDKLMEGLRNGRLWFENAKEVSVGEVYGFLKAITESNSIELYYKKFYEAVENAKKNSDEILMKVLESKNRQVIQEEYVNNFREKYVKKKENK